MSSRLHLDLIGSIWVGKLRYDNNDGRNLKTSGNVGFENLWNPKNLKGKIYDGPQSTNSVAFRFRDFNEEGELGDKTSSIKISETQIQIVEDDSPIKQYSTSTSRQRAKIKSMSLDKLDGSKFLSLERSATGNWLWTAAILNNF